MSRARSVLASFLSETSGNFAVTLALVGTVLVAAIGGATDLSRQFWADQAVQRAVDAAALAGAKELQSGTEASAKKVVQMIGEANLPASLTGITFTPLIDTTAGTVSVTADGSIKPNFLELVSIDSLGVKASAASSIEQKQYTDFYFLLDVSESMNIAASEADRVKLEQITKNVNNRPCAFACHEVEPGWSPLSVYQMNQNAPDGPARLRIDVARDASDKLIDKLLSYNSKQNSLKSMRVATGGFGTTFQRGSVPSTNAAALKSSLRTFSVANSHTNYATSLAGFSDEIGTQGTGRSQTSPLKLALLVTDGVRDSDPYFNNFGLGPIDPTICKTLKDKDITLAVLEIKYVANWDQFSFFNNRVAWYYGLISNKLSDCASPGYYFQASVADEAEAKLVAATNALLAQQRRLLQ